MTKDQTGETNHSLHRHQGRDGELETLKREVERLRAKDAEVSKSSETAEKAIEDDNMTTPGKEHQAENIDSGNISMEFESVLHELEAVATERPALALLVAFSVGVIVGQIFSRR
jgi:hypothetical protein